MMSVASTNWKQSRVSLWPEQERVAPGRRNSVAWACQSAQGETGRQKVGQRSRHFSMQDRVENYNNLQAESGQSRTRKTSKVMFEPLPPDSETFRGTDLFSTSFDDCSSSRTRVF